jgi:hypothetical protein
MLIDCDTCEVRGLACSDCVVSVLLGVPDDGAQLDEPERDAIGVLAEAGLVPPLRLAVPEASTGAGSRAARRSAPGWRSPEVAGGRNTPARHRSGTPGAGHLPGRRSAG